MKLKKGLKFKKHYNAGNINNIKECEVRGIVDDYIVVLSCKKDATKMSDYKEFYQTITKDEFNYLYEKGIYIEIIEPKQDG